MKFLKLITASVLALGLATAAHAQIRVDFTGSTAFRSFALTGLLNTLPTIFDSGTLTYGYTGTTYTSSGSAIFKGNIGGQATIIKTTFTGSEGGNQTVSGQLTVAYLPDSSATSAGGTSGLLDPTINGNPVSNEIPDAAFSDTFQSSSFFFGTYFGKTYPALNSSNTTPGLPTGQIIGIVQFKFVASPAAPAGLNNMTSQLARNLYANGTAALALWTGSPTDHGTTIFALGRNFDSGTRLTAFAETGVGAKAVVKQYEPLDGSGNLITTTGTPIVSWALWPAGSVNGIPYGTGNGGYSSGGQLSKAINNTTPANTLAIAYLGTSDADAQIPSGEVELSYNGVKLGLPENTNLISEGAYTFWGYEHLYYRDSTTGETKTIIDDLALDIFNTDAPVPHYSAMQVQRLTDGGVVVQKY